MRHLKAGRKLGRNATHRLALRRNLARALFTHERIITTLPKAKDLRPFVEKLITLAKKGTLHARRQAAAILGPIAASGVYDKKGDSTGDTVLQLLFATYGPRFADRQGGYTRIIRRHEVRLGDAGATAYIELLKEGEEKVRRNERREPTPAPVPQIATSPVPPPPVEEPVAEVPQTDAQKADDPKTDTPPTA